MDVGSIENRLSASVTGAFRPAKTSTPAVVLTVVNAPERLRTRPPTVLPSRRIVPVAHPGDAPDRHSRRNPCWLDSTTLPRRIVVASTCQTRIGGRAKEATFVPPPRPAAV